MYVYDMCVRYPLGQETVLSGTRVVVSGLVGGFWELNPGPLQEQAVLLTAEPSLLSLTPPFLGFLLYFLM